MKRLFLLAGVLLILNGCAILTKPGKVAPGVSDPAAWQAHQHQLEALQHWSLQGRVASGELLGWTGNLSWRQRGKTFDVRLSGPMGAGGFRAQGDLKLVKIRTRDNTSYTNQPGDLVEQLLGWRFPLMGLRFWVLGLPYPGAAAIVTTGDKGLLKQMVQFGWRLSYTEYQSVGGYQLPRKIVLTDGDNIVQLVVDRWFDLPKP